MIMIRKLTFLTSVVLLSVYGLQRCPYELCVHQSLSVRIYIGVGFWNKNNLLKRKKTAGYQYSRRLTCPKPFSTT